MQMKFGCHEPGCPGGPWKSWIGACLPDGPLSEPQALSIPFKVAFPPSCFFSFPLLSMVLPLLIFCLILATIVCMSGQGGEYNFPRTEGLGLCGSLFLEAQGPCWSAHFSMVRVAAGLQTGSWRITGKCSRAWYVCIDPWRALKPGNQLTGEGWFLDILSNSLGMCGSKD